MDEGRASLAVGGGQGLGRDADGRSPFRTTCPYFRHADPDGSLARPLEKPDPGNRCAAMGWPIEPSLRQQADACLSPEHTACPRFVHADPDPPPAGVVPVEPPRPQPRRRPPRERVAGARRGSGATLVALLILIGSATTSFGFVLSRGGLSLPSAPADAGDVAGATATPAATLVAVATASPTAVPTPEPTASPSPTPSPTPTASPTPTPTPKPAPAATPRSDRYNYLEPCPTKPNCWIYTIRSGDALYNLARYFGHPIETIYRLNPWTKTRGIHPGDKLILPPPTL